MQERSSIPGAWDEGTSQALPKGEATPVTSEPSRGDHQNPNADPDRTDENPAVADIVGLAAKNPAAVALGRMGGKKGGKARAARMTADERSQAARHAAAVRWSSHDTDKR